MDDGHLPAPRREPRANTIEGRYKKPASIYEINDLYSALQELVNSSPAPTRRRRKGTGTNPDSSDSWTSGADSPDVRSRPLHERKTLRIVRSTSNITRRYSSTENPVHQHTERKILKTQEMKSKKLSDQRPPIDGYSLNGSPKMILKKSKSDVSRLRSKSSLDGMKTMAEKIRDQRLKFTQGLRRREMEEEGRVVEEKHIKDIDDLVEWAKLDISQSDKVKKKSKKANTKARCTIESALNKIRPNCSDSNLKSLEVSSRLNRWYEKASAMALGDIGDDKESYESYSGSESDEMPKDMATLKKGKSLDAIDLDLGCFTPDDLLDKWMKQKKNSLRAEERGRSASETSVEPITPEESDSSLLSIGKDDVQLEEFAAKEEQTTSTPLVINRIIVSQPSVDESRNGNDTNEAQAGNLPNQPIFYIPNLKDDEDSKTTVIYEEEKTYSSKVRNRPRSRSELDTGMFNERDEEAWKAVEKAAERRAKSFGSLQRRASLEATVRKEHRERLLDASERRSQRPRSLVINSDTREESSGMKETIKDRPIMQDLGSKDIDANANICQRGKKHDKGKKLSKFPEKLKTLLSGKKV